VDPQYGKILPLTTGRLILQRLHEFVESKIKLWQTAVYITFNRGVASHSETLTGSKILVSDFQQHFRTRLKGFAIQPQSKSIIEVGHRCWTIRPGSRSPFKFPHNGVGLTHFHPNSSHTDDPNWLHTDASSGRLEGLGIPARYTMTLHSNNRLTHPHFQILCQCRSPSDTNTCTLN